MLKNQIDRILERQPSLKYDESKKKFEGILHISKHDFYEVVIHCSGFPETFPTVYEVGERIPKKMDRHKYRGSDICCFTTKAKEQILLKTKIKTLELFFTNILIPFFENNSFYEINKAYKYGEYSHAELGIIEGYQDILDVKNIYLIIQIIKDRLSQPKIRFRDDCYCRSGKTLKKCNNGYHSARYRDFRLINKEILLYDLKKIELKY